MVGSVAISRGFVSLQFPTIVLPIFARRRHYYARGLHARLSHAF